MKATGTFWAGGELTGETVLLGTPAELIDAVIAHVDPDGLPASATRYEARLCLAAVLAQMLQERLVTEAIELGDFDLVTAPDEVVERLTEPRTPIGLTTPAWTTAVVPLILVAGAERFIMPEGIVFIFPSATDTGLLAAMARSGLLSAGRLDSAGPARG
jgi:hypothetical protein